MRRIDSELVRNLSVHARRMIVTKVISACKTKKDAAELLGVSRQALYKYLKDEYQPSDLKMLEILPKLTMEDFYEVLLEDLKEYAELVIRRVGRESVEKTLTALFT